MSVITDAFTDIRGEVREYERVAVMPSDKLSTDKKKAIAGTKQTKNGIEIKMHDKVRALELLGRHLGLFKDKVEVSGSDEGMNKLNSILEQLTK